MPTAGFRLTPAILLLLMKRFSLWAIVALAGLASLDPARAQEKDRDRKKVERPQLEKSEGAAAEAKDNEEKQGFRIGVDVDQVVVNLTVHDRDGTLVPGLKQENFQVYEDKVLQSITNFGQVDLPSSIGLVMDTSGSMKKKLDFVVRAAKLFIDKSNPDNELFLIEFNNQVLQVENFTRDFDDVRDSLDNMIASGGTALYDAIYLGVEKANEGSEAKKVLLVFTDGDDRDSYYKIDELLAKIRESDAQVYMIVFMDEGLDRSGGFFGIKKSEKEKLTEKMADIAEATGGKVFYPEKLEDLEKVFAGVAEELRNQYRIAYISTNKARDGSWREIRVQLANLQSKELQYRVRTRRGYYAK
ncbi:MAG: VWA domain-containing protein [Acidobacteria bacterium]|nr:VWA domain-containing protein [Acidobacteriota bacterium]